MHPLRKGHSLRLPLSLRAPKTWNSLSYVGEMNEAFLTAATGAQSIPSVPLLPEGKGRRPVVFCPPLLWDCLFRGTPCFQALSFGSTTVYMFTPLSHNLQ